jgi:hypothetical protein
MTVDGAVEIPATREQQLCDYVVMRANRGDDLASILAGALDVFGEDPPAADVRRCRMCGCTDDDACHPPCSWIAADLCSACGQVILTGLRNLKRANGWAQLGLA